MLLPSLRATLRARNGFGCSSPTKVAFTTTWRLRGRYAARARRGRGGGAAETWWPTRRRGWWGCKVTYLVADAEARAVARDDHRLRDVDVPRPDHKLGPDALHLARVPDQVPLRRLLRAARRPARLPARARRRGPRGPPVAPPPLPDAASDPAACLPPPRAPPPAAHAPWSHSVAPRAHPQRLAGPCRPACRRRPRPRRCATGAARRAPARAWRGGVAPVAAVAVVPAPSRVRPLRRWSGPAALLPPAAIRAAARAAARAALSPAVRARPAHAAKGAAARATVRSAVRGAVPAPAGRAAIPSGRGGAG